MRRLFIANCTRSRFVLNVRVPEVQKVVRLEIGSGRQESFPLDVTDTQLEGVVAQLVRYGARSRAEIHGKLSDFTGLAYSTDRPLSTDEIVSANEDQLDAAQNRSVEQATRSALATDLNFRDQNSKKGKRTAKTVGVEVFRKTDAGMTEQPMMNIEISEQGSTRGGLEAARLPA